MEAISRSFLKNQQYIDKIGNALIVFTGRGGSGKTMRLVQLAYDLYQNQDAQVLILTYNKALVADITRLLTLMGVRSTNAECCVKIRTVHGYLREVMVGFGLDVKNDYLDQYERHKHSLLQLVGGATPEEVRGLVQYNNNALNWDFIFIDESQDWPPDERDILYALHGHQHFVLADGIDQLVRSSERIDWRENLHKKDTKIIPLRRTLRLKAGLCKFVNAVAGALGVCDWNLLPTEEAYGGRVVVIHGNWESYCRNKVLHEELLEQNRKDGNCNVDALFCVHPGLTGYSGGKKYSYVGSIFKSWGYDCWDGVDEDIREKCPTRLEQLRILQYDSCRGLEGWIVIAFELDRYFEHQLNHFKPPERLKERPFHDATAAASDFAKQWMLIPLTRAIDTLVIQITSPATTMGSAVAAAARECGELVEWRKL